MLFQEIAKPVYGAGFGDASFSMEATSKVVGNDNCTGLTIIALKVVSMVVIFGAGTRKPEVDRESLIRDGGSPGRIRPSRFFVLFGADTGRTDIEDLASVVGLGSEVGNTLDPFVGILEVVVRDVAKALVPEKTSSFSRDGGYRSVTLNILMEGK